MKMALSIVLFLIVVLAPVVAQESTERVEVTAPPKSEDSILVEMTSDLLSAFVLEIEIQVVMQRGPEKREIFTQTFVHYDHGGKWYLRRVEPLSNSRWEIYSLGFGRRQLYIRKDQQDFRFAADPLELNNWLITSLKDFYELVEPQRTALMEEDSDSMQFTAKKFMGIDSRCREWKGKGNEEGGNRAYLCVAGDNGVILQGELARKTTEPAGEFPLEISTEAHFRVNALGNNVTRVEAPQVATLR